MEMNNSSELMLEALLKAGASASDSAFMRRVDELDAETPDVPPSKEREKRLRRLLQRADRSNRRHSHTTVGKVAAAVLIIALAGLAAATVGVDAIRSYFLNFVLDEGAPSTSFNFTGKEILSAQYKLGYVPEGYTMRRSDFDENYTYFYYESEDGGWFDFNADPLEGNYGVDTEDAVVESITINGYDAILISKEDVRILVWFNSYNAFNMCGDISGDEMIKIAENVKIKKK